MSRPKKPNDKICIFCGSENQKRNGFDRYDRQKYKCADCGRIWTFDSDPTKQPRRKFVSKEQQIQRLKDVLLMSLDESPRIHEANKVYVTARNPEGVYFVDGWIDLEYIAEIITKEEWKYVA